MARVELQRLEKAYPGVKALDAVDLVIESGEFFTLLGPSGCGKTTLLRTIAGFNRQDSGHVVVGDQPVDQVPAYRRNIGMVFQDYAIFPHLSVARNVAFGLENRGLPRAEIKERVARALELVQLAAHADRMPHQLSGGQQQRVGLARAMVINPKILLMDEPLSNLDAKLRVELREDIRDLQRRLGITTIYVTHDQEEALVISDRICVMQGGRVHQVGTPVEIYTRPGTLFVAGFVGAMNVLERSETGPGGRVDIGRRPMAIPGLEPGRAVHLAIRPEDVVLLEASAAADDALLLDGTVDRIAYAGREAVYRVDCAGQGPMLAQAHRPGAALLDRLGAEVVLALPLDRLHAFDAGTGQRIELRA